jgi:hypothetical protein
LHKSSVYRASDKVIACAIFADFTLPPPNLRTAHRNGKRRAKVTSGRLLGGKVNKTIGIEDGALRQCSALQLV